MENVTKWAGGAVIIHRSNITMFQSNFTANRAEVGGAIYAERNSVIVINESVRFE